MRLSSSTRFSPARVSGLTICVTIGLFCACHLGAQSGPATTMPTDASQAPGNPASSYALSGIDNINYYDGNLNIQVPLFTVGGRGDASHTITAGIEQRWTLNEAGGTNPLDYNINWLGYTYGNVSVGFATTLTECAYTDADTAYSYIIWTKPDRTQLYLVDTTYNGQPKSVTAVPSDGTCIVSGANRGSTFRSYDGSNVTFTLSSGSLTDGVATSVTGTLTLPDGTQYHTGYGGDLLSATDRNGNQVEYGTFMTTTSGGYYPVTDSAGRSETFTFTEDPNTSDTGYSANDVISYPGLSGATRNVYVTHVKLSSALASGESNLTLGCLFPITSNSTLTNFGDYFYVISAVQLADGSTYSFLYNSYGEVKQLTLPTGAMYKYTWPEATSCTDSTPTDYGFYEHMSTPNEIVRRVQERDEYAPDGTLVSKEIFTPTVTTDPDISGRTATSVQVDFEDGTGALKRREVHQFWGDPTNYVPPTSPVAYPGWTDGMEYESDVYGTDGTTLLSAERKVWQQRPCVSATETWGTEDCWISPISDPSARTNDPQLCQTLTTLGSTSSGTELFYDTTLPFNQLTDLYEFNYGSAPSVASGATCPSASSGFLRRTNTQYYSSAGTSYWSANLNQLPSERIVYDGSTLKADEKWTYDESSPDSLTGLTTASGLASGSHDNTNYSTTNTVRGNVTTHQVWNSTGSAYLPEYFTYNTAGNPLQHVDFRGNSTTFAYSDGAQVAPTTVTNAASLSQTYVYDQYILRPTSITDENSVVTDFAYSGSLDQLVAVKRAVGTSDETWTQYSYPSPVSGILPSPYVVTTSQDQTTAGNGELVSNTFYDGFGRPFETNQIESSTSTISTKVDYDALGRVANAHNPMRGGDSDYYTAFAYDGLGRVLSATPPDGSTVTTSYSGNQTTVTVPNGGPGDSVPIVRTSTQDAAGRITSVVENPGGSPSYTTSYTYDVLNDLLSVTQGSETRTFTYDSLGRIGTASNPESGMVCYGIISGSCTPSYDGNGNLLYRTDARNIQTAYSYDALNRPTAISYSDSTPSVAYTYGSSAGFNDRLVSVTAGSGGMEVFSTITGYDSLGRITASKQSVDDGTTYYTFSYTWNKAGGMKSETYPSGHTVSTTYDLVNRPVSVAGSSTTYLSNLAYAAQGAPASYLYGNSVNRTQSFNNRMQPTGMTDWLTAGGSSNPLLNLTYTYGQATGYNNGNPTSIAVTTAQTPGGTQTNFSQSYVYNAFNQLCAAAEGVTLANCSSSVSGAAWAQQFGYDSYGNMTGTSTGTGIPALPSGSYNPQNQLTGMYTCGSTGSVPFDCAGNQRTIGSSVLSYDAENRQTVDSDTTSGNTFNYTYDGMGERVKKALVSGFTTIYVHDAFGNVAAEYTTGGSSTMPCTTCYLSWDHLGSTRMVTDSSANVVPYGRHDYLPFGYEVPAGIGVRTDGIWQGSGTDSLTAKYTGAERDTETGFDFMQARYNASIQGRFMSPDPGNVGASIGNPQSWNGYSYVGNNPMVFIDPSGLTTCDSNGGNCYDSVTVTDSSDGWPTLPSAPPGTCYSYILDGVQQPNGCDEGQNIVPLTLYSPAPAPVSRAPEQPTQESYAQCVKEGGDYFSLQNGLRQISPSLGDSWIVGAFLGNPISSLIQAGQDFSGGNVGGGANNVAQGLVSFGVTPIAEKVPNVAVSATATVAASVATLTAASSFSLTARVSAVLPLGSLARAGAGALDSFGSWITLPVSATASAFAAIVCGIGR